MSFAQELKDFIAGAQAGQKMIGAASDEEYKKSKMRYQAAITKTIEDKNNDTEGQDLDRKIKENALARGKASIRASDALTANRAAATKALTAPPAVDPMYGDGGIKPNPQVAPPAVPVEAAPKPVVRPDAGMDLSQADPLVDDVEAVPVAMAARGGSIQHFAEGGAVEDDEDPIDAAPVEEDDEPAVSAVPVSVPDAAPTDVSARSRGTPKFSADAALDAGSAGLKYGVSALGLNNRAAVADPRRARGLQAYARGAGAASPIDMDAARKAVDPDNKLSESQRNLAALGAVYQYKLNKDDQAGAQRAAFSMIQHYRMASQQYAAITAAAVEKGDLDGAAKAAMKAYANIPDGKDLKVEKTKDGKFKYSFTDEKTGKTLEAGIESPDKLAAAAIGFAREGFDQSLLAAAGQRAEKPAKKGAVDPNAPMKAPEKKAALAAIDTAYRDQNPDPEEGAGGGDAKPARSKDEARVIKGASFRIQSHPANAGMTPDEVMSVTTKIADPTVLGKSTMNATKAEGGYAVSIDKRKPVFVSEDDMGALMERRNAKMAETKKKADDDAKPGWASRAAGAVGELASAAADYAAPMIDHIKDPNAKYRRRREETARSKTFTEPQIP